MPDVQMPHCNAAISRNFCCSGCSLSPWAMPSMVRSSWPSASAASIRQEQTRRSFSVILQAPQSPDAQPSFEPVRPSGPRSASSMVSYGSHRNSAGSPLMVVDTCSFAMISISLSAVRGDGSRALQEHAGNLGAVDNGAALVVDRTAGGAASGRSSIQRRIVEFAADQRFRRRLDQEHGRGYRAKPDPGRGAYAIFQREADADADHGDVHFGARNHAQVGVARTRRPGRQREADEDLAGQEIGAARSGRHVLHRYLAAAVRPLQRDDGTGCYHGGHTVAGRRAIAQIAARRGPPLDLGGTDQVDGFKHAGPDLAEARVFGKHRTRDGGADAETALGGF